MYYEFLDDWDSILDEFPKKKKDIYFYKKYVGLYEDSYHKATCVICKDNEYIMIMPFLRGDVYGFYDFETAYGYGGPISNTDDSNWNQKAFLGIYDYLNKNNYLCGFIRFHPILKNNLLVPHKVDGRNIQVLYDRQTVFIDTSQNYDDIWTKQITSKNRNMIRKAEKNGLIYQTEMDFFSYDVFIDLYMSTMLRISADEFYFFKREYFDRLKETLSKNSFLATVKKEERIICAAIFMITEQYGHYHLAGSDNNYSSFGANNYLLWQTACKMHDMGVKSFHLGGGTSDSADDKLYRFKKSFGSNEGQFYIGKLIFNQNKYNEICLNWMRNNSEKEEMYGNRLLKYRY